MRSITCKGCLGPSSLRGQRLSVTAGSPAPPPACATRPDMRVGHGRAGCKGRSGPRDREVSAVKSAPPPVPHPLCSGTPFHPTLSIIPTQGVSHQLADTYTGGRPKGGPGVQFSLPPATCHLERGLQEEGRGGGGPQEPSRAMSGAKPKPRLRAPIPRNPDTQGVSAGAQCPLEAVSLCARHRLHHGRVTHFHF